MDTKTIAALLEEIKHLQEAKGLLEKVFQEIGPYMYDEVSKETWGKVCRFFKFDDSE